MWGGTLLICFFLFFFVFLFGGFKGQVRWPEGPPHLALNPPYLFVFFLLLFVFFLVPFLSLFLIEKPCFSPLKGAFFGLFSVFLFLPPLTFFGLPFSVSLSLSLFCSCLSFFLLVFLLWLSFWFLFLSLFSLFFLLCFCSWIEQHENIKLQFLGFQWMCSLFLVSCLVFSLKSLFLIFLFSWFWVMLLFNIIVFGFKKPKLKNTNFWSKGGLQHNGFFMNLCFARCEKLSFFWGLVFAIFWLLFKKHYKIGIWAHFSKQKITTILTFLNVYYLVQVDCYYLVQVGCVLKNVNLDQIITFKFLARNFFFKKKGLKPLIL